MSSSDKVHDNLLPATSDTYYLQGRNPGTSLRSNWMEHRVMLDVLTRINIPMTPFATKPEGADP